MALATRGVAACKLRFVAWQQTHKTSEVWRMAATTFLQVCYKVAGAGCLLLILTCACVLQ